LGRDSVESGLVRFSRAWWNDRENDQLSKPLRMGALRRCPAQRPVLDPDPPGRGPRQAKLEAAGPFVVGDNLWLGDGVIVCPGVGTGQNTVVGAGAVDQGPAGKAVAVGNPARVIRLL
jgi:hypothetical protein